MVPTNWRTTLIGLVAVLAGYLMQTSGLGGLFFFGVSLVLFGAAGLLSESRMYSRGHRWPVVLVSVAAVACLFGAWAGSALSATWILLAAVGLIATELSLELASERATESSAEPESEGATLPRPVGRTPGLLIAGIGSVVLGVAVLRGLGVGLLPIAVILAAALAFAWMASSDNDAALIVLPILVIMLLWASAPRSEGPADPAQMVSKANEDEGYMLVLGDSYTSGEGSETYIDGTNTVEENAASTNDCRQSQTAWPWRVAQDPGAAENIPSRILFVACSGAVTENISGQPFLREADDGIGPRSLDSPAEIGVADALLAEAHVTRPPSLIILGIGGNDAGFSQVGTTCVGPGSCVEVADQFIGEPEEGEPTETRRDGTYEPIAAIGDDLDRAYTEIQERFGTDVPVVVTAYPRPINESGACRVLLNIEERAFVNRFVEDLNGLIEAKASQHGFHFLDELEGSLEPDQRLCDQGRNKGLNFVDLNPTVGTTVDFLNPAKWTHNSFHPNADGHKAMAETARSWFAKTDLNDPVKRLETPTIAIGNTPQCKPEGTPACDVSKLNWTKNQAHSGYRKVVWPLLLAVLGMWYILRWGQPLVAKLTTTRNRGGGRAGKLFEPLGLAVTNSSSAIRTAVARLVRPVCKPLSKSKLWKWLR